MRETPFLAGREDCLANLRRMTAFAGLDDAHLRTLLSRSRIRAYDPGEVVLCEGDTDRTVYFLIAGSLRVEKAGARVGTLAGPGDVFGEMGVITGSGRTATVRAEAASMCLAVDGAFLDGLGEQDSAACQAVLYRMFAHTLAERLRHASQELARARKALEKAE